MSSASAASELYKRQVVNYGCGDGTHAWTFSPASGYYIVVVPAEAAPPHCPLDEAAAPWSLRGAPGSSAMNASMRSSSHGSHFHTNRSPLYKPLLHMHKRAVFTAHFNTGKEIDPRKGE